MERMISTYTYTLFDVCLKLYCCMVCSGNVERGIHMYSKRYNIVHRYIFFISTHIYLELMVLMMLFHNIFNVVRSAVLVVTSPG